MKRIITAIFCALVLVIPLKSDSDIRVDPVGLAAGGAGPGTDSAIFTVNQDADASTAEDACLELLAGDGANLQKWQICNDSSEKSFSFLYAEDAGSFTEIFNITESSALFTAAAKDLILRTTTSGDVQLLPSANLVLSDGNKSGSTYAGEFLFTGSTAEWDDFDTNFGEVSMFNALNQISVATGDVIGPVSSADSELVRFSGTTGKVIKDAGVVILSDAGVAGGFTAIGIGTLSPAAPFHLAPTASGTPGINGSMFRVDTGTFTDTATAASGTAGIAIGNTIAGPTFAASNTNVTTDAAIGTLISRLPIEGANNTINRASVLTIGDFLDVSPIDGVGTVSINMYGISNGVGNVSDRVGMQMAAAPPITLGDQTATLDRLRVLELQGGTYQSTTNVRTVTNASSLFIDGPPINGGNVVFTNPATSIRVETGISSFGGDVGIGTLDPDSKLHVLNGSAGTVTPDADTVLTIENNGDAIISLLTPDVNSSGIIFGNPTDSTKAGIEFNRTGVGGSPLGLQFFVNSGSTKMSIDETGGVGIGSFGVNDSSAILQANSTTRGFLMPRLTTTQRDAISTPATGLEIYNLTTAEPEFFNGSIWITTGGSAAGGSDTQVQYNNAGAFGGITGVTTSGSDLKFADSTSLILGNSNDLVIFHSGINSRITNNTGNLELINGTGGDLILESTSPTQNIVARLGSTTNSTHFDVEDNLNEILLSVNGDGNVVIGQQNALSRFHVLEETTTTGTTTGVTIEQLDTGDSLLQFVLSIADTQRWVMGIDNNDANKFKIASTAGLGTDTRLTIDTNGSIGIGTSDPNANAILQLDSTTQGFTPPRMTTAERDAIAFSTAGLTIFNTTTNEFEFFNGSSWIGTGDVPGGAVNTIQFNNAGTLGGIGPVTTNGTDIIFADNADAIFGNATDLTIRHTGTDNQIISNTGKLSIFSNGNDDFSLSSGGLNTDIVFRLGSSTSSTNFIFENIAGTDILTMNGAGDASFGTGIDITSFGTSLDLNDSATMRLGTGFDLNIFHDGTNSVLVNQTGKFLIQQNAAADLEIHNINATTDIVMKLGTATNATHLTIQDSAAVELMRFDGAGDMLIGDLSTITNPDSELHIHRGSAGAVSAGGEAVLTLENSGNVAMQFLTPDANHQHIIFGRPSNAFHGSIFYNQTGTPDGFRFETGGDVLAVAIDQNQALAIGTGQADTSAALEILDTARGFLPPRLTTTQRDAISAPATGLQIHNTSTNQPEFFNGSIWSAGIGAETLAQTLSIGNSTGGTDIVISSGDSITTPTSAVGGDLDITLGSGTAGVGGDFVVAAGNGGGVTDFPGGNVLLFSGNGIVGGAGGVALLQAGNAGLTGLGGTLVLSAGDGGATSGAGGVINITSGSATTSGVGGPINVTAGDGGSTTGAGGAVNIDAGDATGTDSDGGDIFITAGTETGTGIAGVIEMNGNVGVGTSPSSRLHVLDASAINGFSIQRIAKADTNTDLGSTAVDDSYYLHLGGQEFGVGSQRLLGFGFRNAQTFLPAHIGYVETDTFSATKGELIFATRDVTTDTEPTERMRIDTAGNVGIGTDNPSQALHVNGDTSDVHIKLDTTGADPAFVLTTIGQQDWSIGIDFNDSGKLKIGTSTAVGANTRLTIESNGDVGIGTADPDSLLHIFDGSAGAVTAVSQTSLTLENDIDTYINFLVPDSNSGGIFFGRGTVNNDGGFFYNAAVSQGFEFRTGGNNTRMVIDSGGNVGIGINPPVSRLHISENTTTGDATTGVTIEQTNSSGEALLHFKDAFATFTMGMDNDDDNQFYITPGSFINTSQGLNIDRTTGRVSIGNVSGGSNQLNVGGDISVTTGNGYNVQSVEVLSSTTLGSGVINSSLENITPANNQSLGIETTGTGELNIEAEQGISIGVAGTSASPILLQIESANFGAGTGQVSIVSDIWSINGLGVADGLTAVGIGTSTIDASALLELTSTTQGFLPPRMTTVLRDLISLPATGLELFNITTNEPEFFNGTTWVGTGDVPGGTNLQLQYNNNGVLGGATGITFESSSLKLSSGTPLSMGDNAELQMEFDGTAGSLFNTVGEFFFTQQASENIIFSNLGFNNDILFFTGSPTSSSSVTFKNSSGTDIAVFNGAGDVSIPNGDFTVVENTILNGGQTVKRTAVADADYTVLTSDYLIAYTSITADRTVNLPAAATAGLGKLYVIKDESGSVGGAIELIIDPNGTETIDGLSVFEITVGFEAISIYTNGSNWFIF